MSPFTIMWAMERGCLECSRWSLFAIVEKHGNRLIRTTNRWGEPLLTRVSRLPAYLPGRQPGDMPCPKEGLNHLSPLLPPMSTGGRMGWYLDGGARSARTAFLAPPQPCEGDNMACVGDPLGTCYLYQGGDLDFLQEPRLREQTGWRLGYHTGGKTAKTNREEAWTSYRGESCENNQGRSLYIIQGGKLQEQTG
jgi:hypothetical protein